MHAAEFMTEAPKYGSVPSSWTGITGRMDARSMLALQHAVREQGVDPKDQTAVQNVWTDLIAKAKARYAALRKEGGRDRQEYEARAAARSKEMGELVNTFPGVRGLSSTGR